jgi:hypothetical protein
VSAEFAVFDPATAPRNGAAFRAWFEERLAMEVAEAEDKPDLLTPPLRAWYDAMTARFPDFIRTETYDPGGMDYSFSSDTIHFVKPRARGFDQVESFAKQKAADFGLGTYDIMSDDGHKGRYIVFPDSPLPDPPSFFSKLFGKANG